MINEILSHSFVAAVEGGILIGISVSLMLALSGRITGLSGIIAEGILTLDFKQTWRWFFLLGLLTGGLIVLKLDRDAFASTLNTPIPILIIAGLLVGFGTRLGGGCTSGHGICGVSRLSPRSIIATLIFMLFGMLTATFFGKMLIL